MSESPTAPESTEETFISHLIELRSRLLHSIIAVVVVLRVPCSLGEGYLRAAGSAAAQGAAARQHDDRNRRYRHVPGPAQGNADGGFSDRAALRALSDVGVCGTGAVPARKAARAAGDLFQRAVLRHRHGIRLLRRLSDRVRLLRRLCAGGRADDDRHRQVPVVRAHDVHRVRHHLRGAGRGRRAGAPGRRRTEEAARDPWLRHRRRVRRRRDLRSAGRALAGNAGRSPLAALRAGTARRALRLRVHARNGRGRRARRRSSGRWGRPCRRFSRPALAACRR